MESNQLLELDRLSATPYIDYPAIPSWFPALIGGYWTAMTGAVLCAKHDHAIWTIVIAVVALGVLMTFQRSYRKRWGTWPLMGNAPAEIRNAYFLNLASVVACVVVTGISFAFAPWYITLIVAFALFTTAYWAYERRIYPRAADRVRRRLG